MEPIEYQTLLLQIVILLLAATITVGCILIYYFLKVSRDIELQIRMQKAARHERKREIQQETGKAPHTVFVPETATTKTVAEKAGAVSSIAPIKTDEELPGINDAIFDTGPVIPEQLTTVPLEEELVRDTGSALATGDTDYAGTEDQAAVTAPAFQQPADHVTLEDIKVRYGLSALTLATEDGLLIGSTEPDQDETAARFSQRYSETGEGWEDGAFIFSLIYKGSMVIGMAGSNTPLPDEVGSSIISDVRAVLSTMI